MTLLVDVQLLGTVQASVGGAALALRGPRQQRLVAALALEVPRVVSMDRLVDVVWPSGAPATARRQVQDLASQLRAGFSAAGAQAGLLHRGDTGYALRLPAAAVDAGRFRAAVAAGLALRADAPGQAAAQLRSALGQWRGAALDGLDCPALDADRASLDELRLTVWEQVIELELALGQPDRLMSDLALLTCRYPARERLVRLHMHALYLAGRTADALGAYHRLSRRLDDELGLRPGPELQQMYGAVLRDDPRLAGSSPGPAPVARAAPPGSAGAATAGTAPAGAFPGGPSTASVSTASAAPAGTAVTGAAPAARPPRQLPPDLADFTGRADDVLWLCDALAPGGTDRAGHAAAGAAGAGAAGAEAAGAEAAGAEAAGAGQSPVVVLSGPGGIGKTALAVHAAHRLSPLFPDGQVYADMRGTAPDALTGGDLAGVLLTALGAGADAGPGVSLPDTASERAALLRSRLHGQRVLIVLDNAADHGQVTASLPASAGCAVLVTSRHQLRGLPGARHRELAPLGPGEALDLLAAVAGRHRATAEPAAARELVRLCAGLPLAVRLSAAQLAAQPGVTVTALATLMAGEHQRLDGLRTGDLSVRSSFLAGYESLAARPGGGAALAAAFRRLCLADCAEFSLAAAAALLGQPAPQAAAALAGLVDASLVQASPGGRYRLHDLLRIFGRECAEATDPAAGRTAALRALMSWQIHSADNANEAMSTLERHVDPEMIEAAGEPARFATREAAMAWLDTELPGLICSVSQASAQGLHDCTWLLTVALWEAFHRRGNWASWVSTCEIALRSTVALGNRRAEARIRGSLGTGYVRAGRTGDAISCYTEGLAAARDAGQPVRTTAALLTNLGSALEEAGRPADALPLHQQALQVFMESGLRHAECLVRLNIAGTQRKLGRLAEAEAGYRAGVACPAGDDFHIGLALAGLGAMSLDQQRPAEAAGYYLRALDRHRRAGDRPSELRTLDRLAEALAADGQPDAAAQHQFAARLVRRELGPAG